MSEAALPTRHGLGRVGGLGREAFARASEEPYRRRPADLVITLAALAALVAAAVHDGEPTPFELDVTRALTHLPSEVRGIFVMLFRLGALWAVGLVTVAALLARRGRLARDLVIAGVGAWAVARFLAFLTDGSGAAKAFSSVVELDTAPRFPTVSLAVLVAVIFAAAPYLTRAVRLLGFTVVVLAAPGAIAIGHAFPDDVVGALALGLLVAAAIHVAFGSPGGRPTLTQIALALAELGVDTTDLELARTQLFGRTAVTALSAGGPLDVTVIGRDERDARYLAKAFRFLRHRDAGPALFHSRLQEVEHEAYVLLRAERSGVRVPELVEVGVAGPDAAVLVPRTVDGRALADLLLVEVTDEVLGAAWQQVAALHTVGIAHGHLDARHVVVTDAGPVLTGFTAASSAAPVGRRSADVANLLATTAAVVGAERAVAAARTGLGDDALGAAVPYLQPGVLTRDVRSTLKHTKATMQELRTVVSQALGVDVPEIEELRRVPPGTILTFAMTAFGVWALLGVIGDPAELWRQIRDANFWFVLLGFALWFLTNLTYATSALGGLPPAADVPLLPADDHPVGGVVPQPRDSGWSGHDADEHPLPPEARHPGPHRSRLGHPADARLHDGAVRAPLRDQRGGRRSDLARGPRHRQRRGCPRRPRRRARGDRGRRSRARRGDRDDRAQAPGEGRAADRHDGAQRVVGAHLAAQARPDLRRLATCSAASTGAPATR